MEMTESTLRDLIRRELTVWRFVQTRFEPFIIVMPAQIQKYYDEILVPELAQTGAPLPALELVREQIREILILEKTNQEMDRWVKNMRGKAQVSVLLFRATPSLSQSPPRTPDRVGTAAHHDRADRQVSALRPRSCCRVDQVVCGLWSVVCGLWSAGLRSAVCRSVILFVRIHDQCHRPSLMRETFIVA